MDDIAKPTAEMSAAGAAVLQRRGQYLRGDTLAVEVYAAMEAHRVSPQTTGRDLVEENARLRAALKPFAEFARITFSDTLGSAGDRDENVVAIASGSWTGDAVVTFGDCRLAMDVLGLPAVGVAQDGA